MAVFTLSLASWFFGGFVTLPHQEYVAACIPMAYRGRYTGYSFTIGGILSVLNASVGGIILKYASKPASFGWLYILAWLVCQGGYLLALIGREERTPVEKSPKAWSRGMFVAFWNDKLFVKLMIVNMINSVIIAPAIGFYTIYGFKDLKLAASMSAIFAILQTLTRAVVSSPVGMLVDKVGPRRVYSLAPLLAVPASFAVVFIGRCFNINGLGLYIGVGLSALYVAAIYSSFTALSYGMPKPENRGGHYTFQILISYASQALGPIIMGCILDTKVMHGISIMGHKFNNYTFLFFLQAIVCLIVAPLSWYLLKQISDKTEDYA
ncbi:MAG: MFS transporter [Armatimonadota bacterium]